MNEEVSVDNTAIYALLPFYVFGMSLIGALSWWMNNNMGELKLGPFAIAGGKVADGTQTYLGAGKGVGAIPLFFTMAASLYSGYSISGIANEAYTFGFLAVRWIPAGVALYAAFMVLAPRMHALGKARGYLTVSEIIYDRYSQPAMSPAVLHALRLLLPMCMLTLRSHVPIFDPNTLATRTHARTHTHQYIHHDHGSPRTKPSWRLFTTYLSQQY